MSLTQINKAGLDEIALDHVFTVGASGTDHYTFQGEGLNGTVNDPTLYLTRGKTYRFEKGSAHPLRIQSTQGENGTAYNTGVTNNGGTGTVIIEVQHDAPDVLYYQCTSHAAMNGVLYITGALADGGVTTAKLANGAVTNTKLSGDIAANKLEVNNNHIIIGDANADGALQTLSGDVTMNNTGAVTIANNAVTTDKIADDAIRTRHYGDNSIDTAHIADQAVTLAKLPHGTSSNDGKFLRANNGADPTFATVNTDLVSDTSPQLGGDLQTNGNHIGFADSNMARFGNGNDLNVYHDGSNSYVSHDNGSGHLYLQGDAIRLRTRSATGNDDYVVCSQGGPVALYHNDVKKFETTSSGVTVSGQTQIDGRCFPYSDNASDLGLSSNRWQDLYLSGNIYLGGTGSANALDDYEEGTWTPQIKGTGGAGTASYNSQTGRYIKVGNFVYLTAEVNWSSGSANGELRITNLPFQPTTDCEGIGNAMFHNVTIGGDTANISPYVGENNTYMYFYQSRQGTQSWVTLGYDGSGAIIMNISFRVA